MNSTRIRATALIKETRSCSYIFHFIEKDLFGEKDTAIEPDTNVFGLIALLKENDFFKKTEEERIKIFEQMLKDKRIQIAENVYATIWKS